MARSTSRKVNLRDGYYIEVSNRLGGAVIKLSRPTKREAMALIKLHQKSKNVRYLGKYENNKCVEDKL